MGKGLSVFLLAWHGRTLLFLNSPSCGIYMYFFLNSLTRTSDVNRVVHQKRTDAKEDI